MSEERATLWRYQSAVASNPILGPIRVQQITMAIQAQQLESSVAGSSLGGLPVADSALADAQKISGIITRKAGKYAGIPELLGGDQAAAKSPCMANHTEWPSMVYIMRSLRRKGAAYWLRQRWGSLRLLMTCFQPAGNRVISRPPMHTVSPGLACAV